MDIIHPEDQEELHLLLERAEKGEEIHAGVSLRAYTKTANFDGWKWEWLRLSGKISLQSYSLVMDVSKQKIAQDALVQSNRKLNLLSSITRHDVLNQITILLAYLDLLKKKNKDPELEPFIAKQVEATQAIRTQIVFQRSIKMLASKNPNGKTLGKQLPCHGIWTR
jgi:hypothetical protein